MLGARQLLDVALFWNAATQALFPKGGVRAIFKEFHRRYFRGRTSKTASKSNYFLAIKCSINVIHPGTNWDKIVRLIQGILLR